MNLKCTSRDDSISIDHSSIQSSPTLAAIQQLILKNNTNGSKHTPTTVVTNDQQIVLKTKSLSSSHKDVKNNSQDSNKNDDKIIINIPASASTTTSSHHPSIHSSSSQQAHKIIVKSPINEFEKVFHGITRALNHEHDDIWTADIIHKVEDMSTALKQEAEHYQQFATQTNFKDKVVRIIQLIFTSAGIFINTSAMDSTAIKNINIAFSVCVGFLNGFEGIFKYNKRAYQYAETGLALDGLSRTLRTQLITPLSNRRDPNELILFIENSRDKMLKKLIES